MYVSPIRTVTPVRAAAAPRPVESTSQANKPAVVAAKPVVKAQTEPWTFARIAKAAGVGVGGFAVGGGATVVADMLFHWGSNGGTAWPGGIYMMAAGGVALAAAALYAKLSSK